MREREELMKHYDKILLDLSLIVFIQLVHLTFTILARLRENVHQLIELIEEGQTDRQKDRLKQKQAITTSGARPQCRKQKPKHIFWSQNKVVVASTRVCVRACVRECVRACHTHTHTRTHARTRVHK